MDFGQYIQILVYIFPLVWYDASPAVRMGDSSLNLVLEANRTLALKLHSLCRLYTPTPKGCSTIT